MTDKVKKDLEKFTDEILRIRSRHVHEYPELVDTEKTEQFKRIITDHIIPLVDEASVVIGRSGCSLHYYSNELAEIRDPKKRIFIQILFYPYGHSKITLGVNAPFLQFAYSPSKENIKVTRKLSIKSDEGRVKIDEVEIDDFVQERVDEYFSGFFRDLIRYNKHYTS